MSAQMNLQRIEGSGWRVGLGNMLRKELGEWWGTRTWLVHAIIWTLILNGLLAALLWTTPTPPPDMTAEEIAAMEAATDIAIDGLEVFLVMAGMATAVGVVIIGQGMLLDEKHSGTLEWVLSKPVSRAAILVSKLIANGLGILVIMIALQGVIAYVQLAAAGSDIAALPFAAALLLVGLSDLFYLTLTLLLGVVAKGRGAVLGIPLALIFGYQIVLGIVPQLATIMPWKLTTPIGPEGAVALQVATQQPNIDPLPIVITAAWCVLFTGVAIWRFGKQEF